MAEPKKKTSKARTRMRRAHDALRSPDLSVCPQCGAPKRSHHVCPECGHYRGRQIFEVEKEDEV
jgi:large subunit ribosomal protein L32